MRVFDSRSGSFKCIMDQSKFIVSIWMKDSISEEIIE